MGDEIGTSPHRRLLLHANIGTVGDWGYPTSHSEPEAFLNYHENIWSRIPSSFDLCLIDGRFRVASFAQAIMRSAAYTIIGVHDYEREAYHAVEAIAQPIARVETLVFFQRRPTASWKQIQKIIDTYKYIPD